MWPPNVVKCLVLKRFASLPTSPRHGKQFFFLGQLDVIPRDLQMMVTNFLDQGAISKALYSLLRGRDTSWPDGWPAEVPHRFSPANIPVLPLPPPYTL
jgi:hypothetical protein